MVYDYNQLYINVVSPSFPVLPSRPGRMFMYIETRFGHQVICYAGNPIAGQISIPYNPRGEINTVKRCDMPYLMDYSVYGINLASPFGSALMVFETYDTEYECCPWRYRTCPTTMNTVTVTTSPSRPWVMILPSNPRRRTLILSQRLDAFFGSRFYSSPIARTDMYGMVGDNSLSGCIKRREVGHYVCDPVWVASQNLAFSETITATEICD